MKIVIVANFTHNFDEGIVDGRFTYIAEMLASRGHQVEIVTTNFDHVKKEHRKNLNIDITRVKLPIAMNQDIAGMLV